MSVYNSRLKKLRRSLRKQKIDALLVTSFTNVTYLTGFTGDDSYLLVTLDGEQLLSDARFSTQIEEECPELETRIRETHEKMFDVVAQMLVNLGIERLGIEQSSMTVGEHQSLAKQLKQIDIKPTEGLVEDLRLIKDRDEVAQIRTACEQARRAYDVIRASWTAEATERDLARELEYQARRFGGQGLSFPAIVAAGPRAALPHATPSDQQVGAAPFTLIDWGVFNNHYASDLTRVVVTQTPSKRFAKVYNTVLEAQLAAIEAIRPGVTCESVDAVARKIITKAGYGKRFGHGLGHGLGMEVHEAPRLSRNQKTKLEAGMVVTVEPGIYLPGWGGVRIEDDILVTKTGYEVLSNVPKQLDECLL